MSRSSGSPLVAVRARSPAARRRQSSVGFGPEREVARVEVVVHVGEELAGLGEGALLGEAGRLGDRGRRARSDRGELRLARGALLEDMGGEPLDAVLRPVLRLFLRAAVEQWVVRPEVPQVAIGLRLDQGRPLAGAGRAAPPLPPPRTSRARPARPRAPRESRSRRRGPRSSRPPPSTRRASPPRSGCSRTRRSPRASRSRRGSSTRAGRPGRKRRRRRTPPTPCPRP